MGNTTKVAPAAGTAGAGDKAGEHVNHEAPPCPDIVPQCGQHCKSSYAAAGEAILPHLLSGRDGARKRRDLMAATGLRDRAFRHGVEALRRSGVVVCADERGYYLPETLGEVLDFIQQEEHRARSTFFTLRAARELATRMQAQEHGEQTQMEGA